MLGINKLLAFLRRSVGLRDDAASATGSLHAKVKYLNDTTVPAVTTSVNANVNTRQKPRGPVGVVPFFQTASSTYVTAYEVTGKGRLVGMLLTDGDKGGRIKLTVDGHVMVNECQVSGAAGRHFPTEHFWYQDAPNALHGLNTITNGGRFNNCEICFKTSLKIELRSTISNTNTLVWLVELE